MNLAQLIIGWFYYGIFYMGLSAFATLVINRVVKHYYTAPLVINAFSILTLLLMFNFTAMSPDDFWYYLLFVYMPIVAASVVFNLTLALIRRDHPLGLISDSMAVDPLNGATTEK